MSASNYGDDKELTIRIPIEIVPDIKEIQEGIKKLQSGEKAERKRLDQQAINQKKLAPRMVPLGKEAPLDLALDATQRKFVTFMKTLTVGISPTIYKMGYPVVAGEEFTKVPRGKEMPREYVKKVPHPDAGLHIYGEDDPPGSIEKIISKVFGGPARAKDALSLLKSPMKMVKFLGPVAIPLIAGLVAIDLIKRLGKELTRKGSVFDRTFKNYIFDRFEALRSREVQQRILVGFGPTAQIVTTTSAGTTNPRDAYNTYEVFNRDQSELEEKFSIRNDSGYD